MQKSKTLSEQVDEKQANVKSELAQRHILTITAEMLFNLSHDMTHALKQNHKRNKHEHH